MSGGSGERTPRPEAAGQATVQWRPLLLATALTVLPAGVALFLYAASDYQGTCAWEETSHWLEARGETLDGSRLAPPAVPDEENLALGSFFTHLFNYQFDPDSEKYSFRPNNGPALDDAQKWPLGPDGVSTNKRPVSPDWTTARLLDLGSYQKYFAAHPDFPHPAAPQAPAQDVLLALTRYVQPLDELARDASERPAARFPVDWETVSARNPPWKHYLVLLSIQQTLRLRAAASLSADRTDAALLDILLGLRLYRATEREPFRLANLMDISELKALLQPIWEGLATRRWSAAQLTALQSGLDHIDLLSQFQLGERGERVFSLVPARKTLTQDFFPRLAPFLPRGWSDLSVAMACRWQQEEVIESIDLPAHRILARRIDAAVLAAARLPLRPATFITRALVAPPIPTMARRNTRMQAAVDEAATACALERYFLDRQAYPADLGSLVPAYLPHVPDDVIAGSPLRYQPTPDGRYRLWSVDWTGADHGGRVVWKDAGKLRIDETQGDCVWQYEALVPGK